MRLIKFNAGKIRFYIVMLAILSIFIWLANTVPANAKTDSSQPADRLELRTGYAGGTYSPVKTFSRSEMEAMANVRQAYSFIDNMPCPVIDSAVGVRLTDIVKACGIAENEIKDFSFWTTDVTGKPYVTLAKAYLTDTRRYYFPHLADSWNADTGEIAFPDPAAAAADAVEVPAIIAVHDNWQREFSPLQPDFEVQDDSVRFRLVFGKSNDLSSSSPEHTASKSAKWIYRIDVTLNGTAATGVTLDKSISTIPVGSTERLTATVLPADASNRNVLWSSNASSVATVDSLGNVTAVGAGMANITAATADGGHTAVCVVAVTVAKAAGDGSGNSYKAGTDVKASGISLNKSSCTITMGNTFQLNAAVEPSEAADRNVNWDSDNKEVASVSPGGLVTAVGEGTANIIATTEDGGFSAVCSVTVVKAEIPVKGVTLNRGSFVLNIGDTFQLAAAVEPSEAADRDVNWSSDNKEVASVSPGGLVAAVGEGTANITATTEDGGFSAVCSVMVNPAQEIFKDIAGHWAEKNIKELAALGAVSGNPDGSFKPEAAVTRAEFTAILVKALVKAGKLTLQSDRTFKDTKGHWAKDYITTAAAYGIVRGYGDGSFEPDAPVTREQIAVMTVRAFKLDRTGERAGFKDSGDISGWAVDAVTALKENGVMAGDPDNAFHPKDKATRAETATVILNALKKSG